VTEVVIIGGGVMGLLTARELRQRGQRVVLLERDQPGRQASWASAGIIGKTVRSADDPFQQLTYVSTQLYPDLARELFEETAIDVQYVERGDLVPAETEAEVAPLAAETRRMQAAGQPVQFIEGAAVRQAEPAVGQRVLAARLQPAGQIENRRLCLALEASCRQRGVEIRVGAVATEILEQSGQVTGVRTLDGEVPAELVVVAAGSWSGQLRGCAPALPVVPQRGQILALGRRDVPLWRSIRPLDDPYIVPRPDGRVIVGATRELAGYEATLTASGLAWLLNRAIELVPGLADAPILETWTGFRPLSLDGLPAIGPASLAGLYYLTGHGPSGIGPAPASVKLLVAQIFGETPPVPPAPFDPRRFVGREIPIGLPARAH
jgi:glycine oxidase